MKKYFYENLLEDIGVFIVILLLSVLVEVFFFNRLYFAVPEDDRVIRTIEDSDIELNDLIYENGSYTVIGKEPSISFKGNNVVLYLNIQTETNKSIFYIETLTDDVYPRTAQKFMPDIDSNSFIRIGKPLNEVKLKILENAETAPVEGFSFSIDKIIIDNTFEFNIFRFIFLSTSIFVLFVLVKYRKYLVKNLHISFIIIAIYCGLNMSFLTPPYQTFDEREHFNKSYQIASFDLGGADEQPIGWPGNIEQFFSYNGNSATYNNYKEKIELVKEFRNTDYSQKEFHNSTAANYLPTAYVFSAIGIFLGKLCHFPFIATFYLGRLTSLLGYSIAMFFIIKKVKVIKNIFFVLGLFPGMMYHVCAYSADGITYVSALAVVAIFINHFKEKNEGITWPKVCLFIFLLSLLITSKMTYAPFCLLYLAIPQKKFHGQYKFFYKLTVIISAGLVMMANFVYSNSVGLNLWAPPGTSVSGQIGFIFGHLFKYILICWRYVEGSFLSYFTNPIGSLAYSGNLASIYIFAVLILLFLIATIDNDGPMFELTIKNKLWILCAIICSWGLTITALYLTYVPVGDVTVVGMQGRYFAPLIILVLMLFNNNNINISKKTKRYLNGFCIWTMFLVICIANFQLLNMYNI